MASAPAVPSVVSVHAITTSWSTELITTTSRSLVRRVISLPKKLQSSTLLQNQFSAEFGRSNGGQFITVTKSGGNDYHGSFYGFMRNRKLNALDNLQIIAGVVREDNGPDTNRQFRSDYFRGGANFSGPLHLPRFGEGGPINSQRQGQALLLCLVRATPHRRCSIGRRYHVRQLLPGLR